MYRTVYAYAYTIAILNFYLVFNSTTEIIVAGGGKYPELLITNVEKYDIFSGRKCYQIVRLFLIMQ
jgi:hypothetical protein